MSCKQYCQQLKFKAMQGSPRPHFAAGWVLADSGAVLKHQYCCVFCRCLVTAVLVVKDFDGTVKVYVTSIASLVADGSRPHCVTAQCLGRLAAQSLLVCDLQ
jgi:hypothetical protein